MLALNGAATEIRGFGASTDRLVIRARNAKGKPSDPADVALIRGPDDIEAAASAGFAGAVVIGEMPIVLPDSLERAAYVPDRFDYLGDGDILGLQPSSKRLRTLYRRNSAHNSFLVTECCNHYCLMCSQPPRDIDDSWILKEIRTALPLIDKTTVSLGFTGGEPLLNWQDFICVLTECRDTLPETAIHVLSNGRAFADTRVVLAWANVHHPDVMVGIPIYAAVDHVHDYVVQAQGAFDETVLGVLKLKDRGQRVEIRVVLHAITAPRIVETCNWLARNLPFVDHVALMGLENTGFAIANDELLWTDPVDYKEDLAAGVDILAAAGVRVSVYNLPRCVLARSVWPYAVQSISDWKNGFVEECDSCSERPWCSGFFTSGRPRYSRGIRPILDP